MKIECEYPNHPGKFILDEAIPAGGMWSGVIGRHLTLRITAWEPGTNVGLMAYNQDNPLDRLNLPDTLKAQHTAKLTQGNVLMSDMGHVLLSITADTCGWHDPLGGHSNAASVKKQYGETTFQEHLNKRYRNAHDNFLIELTKNGLSARDLVGNVNLFSRLDADASGKLHFHPNQAKAGDYIDLRAEMNVLIILNTCPHPFDQSPTYAPKEVGLALFKSSPPGKGDFCRNFRSENERSFYLTERLFEMTGKLPTSASDLTQRSSIRKGER